ncbi:hypothetical protein HY491_01765 [Candidatus Woesearchaeota archaeon]|nr:hypothetical protein [Candidatus Woesearchaeota archaeon]
MRTESFSGIRGIYPADINEEICRDYAAAYLSLFSKAPKLVVGCDTRASSLALKQAVMSALPNVIDVGVAPTPAVSFAVRQYGADGGIIITASHNPPEHNGMKLLRKNGGVLLPQDMQRVIAVFHRGNLVRQVNQKIVDKHAHLLEMYLHYVLNLTRNQWVDAIRRQGFRIVTDPNGGAAAVILDEILKWLHVENISVNDALGIFRRQIEPTADALSSLPEITKKHNALFAAAFDCDADRLEIMLPSGKMLNGNQILALIVDEVLMEEKGIVVVNDATSGLVRRIAENHHADVHEVEVGEVNVVEEMLSCNSPIGGEGSNGGIIIPPGTVRDGILALCFVLRIMAKTGKSIEDLVAALPAYSTFSDQVKVASADIPHIREHIISSFPEHPIQYTGDETGGIKIRFGESFLWFRQSKTEAGTYRVIADAPDAEAAQALLGRGKEVLDMFTTRHAKLL